MTRPYRIRTCDTLIKRLGAYIAKFPWAHQTPIDTAFPRMIHSHGSFLPGGGVPNVLSDTRLQLFLLRKGGGHNEDTGGGV
jgi:hypothetical protein